MRAGRQSLNLPRSDDQSLNLPMSLRVRAAMITSPTFDAVVTIVQSKLPRSIIDTFLCRSSAASSCVDMYIN
eukprot:1183851-Heterocapsa_arctica.AAC.1